MFVRQHVSTRELLDGRCIIWYERHATGGHSELALLNSLPKVITTRRTRELVRWQQH
jgi:hypothetical protein